MFEIYESQDDVEFSISSRLNYVDRIIEESSNFFTRLNIDISYDFKLVVRELLINAIEHGNCKNINSIVICNIEKIGERYFKISVEDEGIGFDYKMLNLSLVSGHANSRKHGYPLINALSDKIEFNTKGNRVTVHMLIPSKIKFEVLIESDIVVIKPSTDLTASILDEFREVLMNHFDKGYSKYCFDMENVCDMDSLSLSVLFSFARMIIEKRKDVILKIINVSEDLNCLFNMTGLNQIFEIKVFIQKI